MKLIMAGAYEYHENHKNAFDMPYYTDCKIAYAFVFTDTSFRSNLVRAHTRASGRYSYVDYDHRGPNKSWKLQKCTSHYALGASCVHYITDVAKHMHSLSYFYPRFMRFTVRRASCARFHYRQINQAGHRTETDSGLPALSATFAARYLRVQMFGQYQNIDITPTCISGLSHNVIRMKQNMRVCRGRICVWEKERERERTKVNVATHAYS